MGLGCEKTLSLPKLCASPETSIGRKQLYAVTEFEVPLSAPERSSATCEFQFSEPPLSAKSSRSPTNVGY